MNGFTWCDGEAACVSVGVPPERECCGTGEFWCDITLACEVDGFFCGPPPPCPWDNTINELDPKCCNFELELFYCEIHEECRHFTDCCPDGEETCKWDLESDLTCYTEEVCCDFEG